MRRDAVASLIPVDNDGIQLVVDANDARLVKTRDNGSNQRWGGKDIDAVISLATVAIVVVDSPVLKSFSSFTLQRLAEPCR